ncbi:hypothetical protein D3C80_1550750 [compost metagenome]
MITGEDVDLRLPAVAGSQCADAVIRLIAHKPNIRYTQLCYYLFDKIKLRNQLQWRIDPVRFIAVIFLGAEGAFAHIPAADYVGRLKRAHRVEKILQKSVHRIGRKPGLRFADISSIRGRIKGPEQQSHSIDDHYPARCC